MLFFVGHLSLCLFCFCFLVCGFHWRMNMEWNKPWNVFSDRVVCTDICDEHVCLLMILEHNLGVLISLRLSTYMFGMIQFEYIIHIFKMGWNHQFVKWWFRRLVRWIHIWVHISINLKCFFLFSSGSWNFPHWKLKTNRKPFYLISRSPKIKNTNGLCV